MTEAHDRPTISIVIPTWNRCDLACRCLRSLADQTFQDVEWIVVDDGSTDGTRGTMERDFPRARVLRLPRNRGFAAATNAGIGAAKGTWLFLLNNDMTLEPDCLERLWTARNRADMLAPLVLWDDDHDTIYSAGDRILPNGRPESWGFRVPRQHFTPPPEIFGVSAGAGLFRREILDTVGVLEASFGAYFEDADLCFRARLAGFTAAFVDDAVAYHIGSASIAGRTWWRSVQCYRNHALLVLRNMPWLLILRNGPAILMERMHQARRLFSSVRCDLGAARALTLWLRAWLSLWACLPRALAARRRIQRHRRISTSELERLLRAGKTP